MLIPYDNLEFKLNADTLIISLPWLTMTCDFNSEHKDEVTKCISALKDNYTSNDAQKFLGEFDDNTIYYRSPRKDTSSTQPTDVSEKKLLIRDKYETPKSKSLSQEVKTLSRISQDLYDPFTIYGFLRSKVFSLDAKLRETAPIMNLLSSLDEEDFFIALEKGLQQNHHITSNFCPLIKNYSEDFHEVKDLMDEIYRAELGHDKLIEHSLRSLGSKPETKKVLKGTKDLMTILSPITECSPLCFALLYDYFEGDGYTKTDPLVDLIKKTSKPDIAKGVQKHYDINSGESHDEFGLKICKKLSPIRESDVDVVCALFIEVLSRIEQNSLQLYKEMTNV